MVISHGGFVCYTEKARKAWHRQERQRQWLKQNHQQQALLP